MEMIEIAEFIYNLGAGSLPFFWIPISIWTVFAALCLLVVQRNDQIPPQANYQILTAVFLGLPLGALLVFMSPFSIAAPEPLQILETPSQILYSSDNSQFVLEAASNIAWHFYHFLGALTLVVITISMFKFALLIKETVQLNKMTTSLVGIPLSDITPLIAQIKRTWGIHDNVFVVFSDENHAPMTFGWRNAFIVIPANLREKEDALHMTLLHEMVHIRNADFVRHWVESAISTFFFFHPMVKTLVSSIDQTREMNCDSEVLSDENVSPKKYASLLLDYASRKTSSPRLSMSMSDSNNNLKRRIVAMKNYQLFSQSMLQSRSLTLLVSGLLLAATTLFVACEVKFDTDKSVTVVEAPQEEHTSVKAQPDGDVFLIVEQMPELIGGLSTLQKSIKYPTIAKRAGIEGKVFVQFTVDENGEVEDPVVAKGIGGGCDEEAVRAITSAHFKPGYQDGNPVKVKMSIPIRFALKESTQAVEIKESIALLKKKLEGVKQDMTKNDPSVSAQVSSKKKKELEEQAYLIERQIKELMEKMEAVVKENGPVIN